jgi:hypothetical protein
MTEMTRAEHLAWCKQRAHDELEHGNGTEAIGNAWASMASDLTKHPETQTHIAIGLGTMMLAGGQLSTEAEMAKFIDGFN